METVAEINLVGKIDPFEKVIDFPKKLGHFVTVLIGSKPDEVFALVITDGIEQQGIHPSDFIIFDIGKKPQPGDICIAPIGHRLFLERVGSKTFDRETPSFEMAQQYLIPGKLIQPGLEQDLHWVPISYNEETQAYFDKVTEEQHWPVGPLPQKYILATALRLIQALAF